MEKRLNLNRHTAQCATCNHPDVADIERGFLNWRSAAKLAQQYGISERAIWNHVKAYDLSERRRQKLVRAFERVVESTVEGLHDGSIQPTPASGVEAAKAIAKLTGQWVDVTAELPLEFQGKTAAELDHYARTGRWPKELEAVNE